jgi:hypothetical protein
MRQLAVEVWSFEPAEECSYSSGEESITRPTSQSRWHTS